MLRVKQRPSGAVCIYIFYHIGRIYHISSRCAYTVSQHWLIVNRERRRRFVYILIRDCLDVKIYTKKEVRVASG